MELLGTIYLIFFILLFLFAKVQSNNIEVTNIFHRAFLCLIGSFFITIILGLPILGITYLIFGIVG